MKPSILYYSDCSFFAGCENMIANFLNDEEIINDFSVSFAYNYSEKYEQGLNARVPNVNYQKYPLGLMKQLVYNKPQNSSLIYSIAHKVFFIFYIPLYKYLSILVNTIHLFLFFTRQKIDILHINNGGYPAAYSCTSAVIAGKIAGINKIVYVVNNIAKDYRHPFRWLDYPIDFFIKRWVNVFITGSEYAGVRLRQVLNLDSNKHITINNGINRRPITLSKEEFKKKYAIPSDRLVASVVANLEVRKGHIFLFEAILQMKNQCTKNLIPFFLIEGAGPEKTILKKFILQNKLEEDIIMIDYIPDIFNLLNTSDFVILPSIDNEDFPNVIIEAMSLGKPVIGTEISGIPEQVVHQKTGIIVKPKCSDDLHQAIKQLVTNPLLIQQFSVESKARFDSMFETPISIKKYQSLYKSLL